MVMELGCARNVNPTPNVAGLSSKAVQEEEGCN